MQFEIAHNREEKSVHGMVNFSSYCIVSTFTLVNKKNHGNESILREKKRVEYDWFAFCFYPSLYTLYSQNQDSCCVVLHHAPHNTWYTNVRVITCTSMYSKKWIIVSKYQKGEAKMVKNWSKIV